MDKGPDIVPCRGGREAFENGLASWKAGGKEEPKQGTAGAGVCVSFGDLRPGDRRDLRLGGWGRFVFPYLLF